MLEICRYNSCPSPVDWDRYVEAHPEASPFLYCALPSVFHRVFGSETFFLEARRKGRLVGVVSLFGVQRFPVNVLDTFPGGVIADDDEAAGELIREIEAVRVDCGYRSYRIVESRRRPRLPGATAEHPAWVASVAAAREASIRDNDLARQIRVAEREGIAIIENPGVGDFYGAYLPAMRSHGTPPFPINLFVESVAQLGPRVSIVVAARYGMPLAGAFLLQHAQTTTVPWLGIVPEGRRLSAGALLYRGIIELAEGAGSTSVDFGLSRVSESAVAYKRRWSAVAVPRWTTVCGAPGWEGEAISSRWSEKFREAWRILPLRLTELLGPPIRRRFPMP